LAEVACPRFYRARVNNPTCARMDARLTFFALEDLSRTVLVTSETAVLRGAITYRGRWCGRNRPVGLWRRSSMLNTGTHVPMEENNTHLYALGI